MGPIIYNRIHLGHGNSPELPPQNDSVAISLFWGPIFDPKKVPGPECWPQIQKSYPGLKIPSLGMKKQKMRAEKLCRIQSSEFQTEPYGASYGQKPFRGGPLNVAILCYVVLCVRYFALFPTMMRSFALVRAISRCFALFRTISHYVALFWTKTAPLSENLKHRHTRSNLGE